MSDAKPAVRTLRIGELATRTGTTPRTIRYYEEVGLLPTRPGSAKGTHRVYDEGDVETLDSLVRRRENAGREVLPGPADIGRLQPAGERPDGEPAVRLQDADHQARRA